MIKWIVEYADNRGVSKIILGDLKGIRNNNHKNSKANSMINNFWSYGWITQRFREKTEEYGIEIVEVDEYKTSSICPRCRSDRVIKRGRLFKCLKCGLEANRDAIGVSNIALVHNGGGVNGLVAQPLLLRWDGCRWEGKSSMNTRRMKTLEARIPLLK
jgi:putative transposase